MNIERLKQLRNFEKGRTIHMRSYLETEPSLVPAEQIFDCATAGCHAGWTCVMMKATECGMSRDFYSVSASYLELDVHEAAFLFSSVAIDDVGICDDFEAQCRLDYLIEHHLSAGTLNEIRSDFRSYLNARTLKGQEA